MEPEFERYFRWLSLLLTAPGPALARPRLLPGRARPRFRTRPLHMDLPIAIALGAGFVARRRQHRHRHRADLLRRRRHAGLPAAGGPLPAAARPARGDRRARAAARAHARPRRGSWRASAIREVPAEALLPGMLVEVRAGETFPADGDGGRGRVPAWTSRSSPASRGRSPPGRGDGLRRHRQPARRRSGVRSSRRARRAASAASCARWRPAPRRRARIVLLADRLAGWFVAVVLLLAALTWWSGGARRPDAALDNAIALLIVTCPCALALATPLAVTVAIGRAARRRHPDQGRRRARGARPPGDDLPRQDRHAHRGPLPADRVGRAGVGQAAGAGAGAPLDPPGRRRLPRGVAAARRPDGRRRAADARRGHRGTGRRPRVVVGSPAFVAGARAPALRRRPTRASAADTPVWVAVDGAVVAAASFGDPLRAGGAGRARAAPRAGLAVRLLSGDARDVVQAVAGRSASAAATGGARPRRRGSSRRSSGPPDRAPS